MLNKYHGNNFKIKLNSANDLSMEMLLKQGVLEIGSPWLTHQST
jgi:hypothetical protein